MQLTSNIPHQIMRAGDNCMLYSAAMVLGVQAKVLAHWIGHDGSSILWPELRDCRKTRGVALEEINDAIQGMGLIFATVVASPVVCNDGIHRYDVFDDTMGKFNKALSNRRGILVGRNFDGIMHAVARDFDGTIYDPNGGNHCDLAIQYFHPISMCVTH